ncbi:hypothetical protein DIE03_02405 [Burkholderia sp. Bp8992]|nr:hypothetical protein DIE03_02405 [Burkholderia sp. Bp8992]
MPRAPPARTAMSHGDSAAAHHICASLPQSASCVACRGTSPVDRQALQRGAEGPIGGDMARRLR